MVLGHRTLPGVLFAVIRVHCPFAQVKGVKEELVAEQASMYTLLEQ